MLGDEQEFDKLTRWEMPGLPQWQQAVLELAPKPPKEDDVTYAPVVAARYLAAQYISGQIDIVPDIVKRSEFGNAVRAVMRQITDIEDLPSCSEDRIRSLQILHNPSLVEVYSTVDDKDHGDENVSNVGRLALLFDILEAETAKLGWAERAACKGMPPEHFHSFSLPRGRLSAEKRQAIRDQVEAILKPCQDCPVTAECKDFGLKFTNDKSGVRVFGGELFGTSHGRQRNLSLILDDRS